MVKFSRRDIIAGAAAAPIGADSLTGLRSGPSTMMPTLTSADDPVVSQVAGWIAERKAIEAMMEGWADQEFALCKKVKPMGLSLTQAYRCGLPEARAMKRLDRKIKLGLTRLERQARAIVLMRTTSAAGAFAKITLGVKIQGPYDWNDDYVYALVQDGCEQLALMLDNRA